MDKTVVIIQARTGSTRFPNKVFAMLNGKPVIQHVIDSLKNISHEHIYAIPDTPSNDILDSWLTERGHKVFRGTEHDVLARFYQCAVINKVDIIIRVCADTVLLRSEDVLNNYVQFIDEGKKRMIYGNGSWVFSIQQLEDAMMHQRHAESREHVVRSMFNSVDYPDDIKRIEEILNAS